MKRQVPLFADGELDRAAHLRETAPTLWGLSQSRVIAFWGLKPLVHDDGGLHLLSSADPVLADLAGPPVFLGVDGDGDALFAADLSNVKVTGGPADPSFRDETVQRIDGVAQAGFCDLRQIMMSLSPWEAEIAATGRAMFAWHEGHVYCGRCGTQTQMQMAGWERLCSECGHKQFPRTDPVVIMLVTHGNDILLGRSPFWPERMYSLLAGFVEPGEPIEAAVIREVHEETGVAVTDVRYVASQPWAFPASLMFGCRANAKSRAITIDPDEIEDAVWVSRERVMSIMAGDDPDIARPRSGAIAHFLLRLWLADRLE
jgi:NAD+ diphosphatase